MNLTWRILILIASLSSSSSYAVNDNAPLDAAASRMLRACARYLDAPRVMMFGLERNGRHALLLGAGDAEESIARLPAFVRSAVLNTEHLIEHAAHDAPRPDDHGLLIPVGAGLGDLTDAYVRFVSFFDYTPTVGLNLCAQEAIRLLREIFNVLVTEFDEMEMDRLRVRRHVLDKLNPPYSSDELNAFYRETNVKLQLAQLAQDAGARAVISPLDLEARDPADDLATVRDLVKALGQAERTGFRVKSRSTSQWPELVDTHDRIAKLQPHSTLVFMTEMRRFTAAAAEVIDRHTATLVLGPVDSLPGNYGLVRAFERAGFTVMRIEDEAQWRTFQRDFERP